MSDNYVDVQDEQKPALKGWPIVINGKRTENIHINPMMELAITFIKTANACESGNNRTGLWPQDAASLMEIAKGIEKLIEDQFHVQAPVDHPDIYAERAGI